jgi:hypothetical protein
MDTVSIGILAIGIAAAAFVLFAYYWWEIRPARRDDN